MGYTFFKIVDFGDGPVAEFLDKHLRDIHDKGIRRLNKESLVDRIANLEKDGRDTTMEKLGLAAMLQAEKQD